MATNEIIIPESCKTEYLINKELVQQHEKKYAYSYLQLERCNHENTKKKMIELQNQVELLQRYLENIKHIKFKS
tara:strand:- start:29825 stop:30046 length:222 start_codon:yes stop_codon:yes gene_type:complete